MKLYAFSDLHIDYKENREWCENIHTDAHSEDAIILAGDLTHDMKKLEEVLCMFVSKFRYVFYVPGNHELWVSKTAEGGILYQDSIEKFHKILAMCERIGVHTKPLKIGLLPSKQVWVVPLFAWYDENLDSIPVDENNELIAGWTDFVMCKWPAHFIPHPLNPHTNNNGNSNNNGNNKPVSPSEYFLNLNEERVNMEYDAPVITFSHFLPRRDVLPPTAYLLIPFLPKVSGTKELDVQIRKLKATTHVFGHTHINRNYDRDGIHYVQNALAYPRERQYWKFPTNISDLEIWKND